MNSEEMESLLHTHLNALNAPGDGALVHPPLDETARVLVRVHGMLALQGAVAVSVAVSWFRGQPIAALGEKTAMELVREGHVGAVMAHLSMLEDGGYA